MFLIDTDVLSSLRRRDRNPAIVRWIESQRTADLHISVVTVGEIERGHYATTTPQSNLCAGPVCVAGPCARLVRRPHSARRSCDRTAVGAVVRDARQ